MKWNTKMMDDKPMTPNHALQRTRRGRLSFISSLLCAGSLSLGRSTAWGIAGGFSEGRQRYRGSLSRLSTEWVIDVCARRGPLR